MSVSLPELVPGPATIGDGSPAGWLRVPVEWSTMGFECDVKNLATSIEMSGSALTATEPVRLRVNEAESDSCRVELFCVAARLCGASAGC
jgi:hypothetical protein